MTEEETRLIALAIRYEMFRPKPDYFATCHHLAERGWLDRYITNDSILFGLSDTGTTALELGVPLGEAKEARN